MALLAPSVVDTHRSMGDAETSRIPKRVAESDAGLLLCVDCQPGNTHLLHGGLTHPLLVRLYQPRSSVSPKIGALIQRSSDPLAWSIYWHPACSSAGSSKICYVSLAPCHRLCSASPCPKGLLLNMGSLQPILPTPYQWQPMRFSLSTLRLRRCQQLSKLPSSCSLSSM